MSRSDCTSVFDAAKLRSHCRAESWPYRRRWAARRARGPAGTVPRPACAPAAQGATAERADIVAGRTMACDGRAQRHGAAKNSGSRSEAGLRQTGSVRQAADYDGLDPVRHSQRIWRAAMVRFYLSSRSRGRPKVRMDVAIGCKHQRKAHAVGSRRHGPRPIPRHGPRKSSVQTASRMRARMSCRVRYCFCDARSGAGPGHADNTDC
jgi:hypothetical protein